MRCLNPVILCLSLSLACASVKQRETGGAREIPDSVIEDLVHFHSGILGDTARIDACSISGVLRRESWINTLSKQAKGHLIQGVNCKSTIARNSSNALALISIQQLPGSLIANFEVSNGVYHHVASYIADRMPNSRFSFNRIVLHDFVIADPAPPPPP